MFDAEDGVGLRLAYCVDGRGPGNAEGRSGLIASGGLIRSLESRVFCFE